MIKWLKSRLSLKAFLLICVVLLFCNSVLFWGIYHFLPQFYERNKDRQTLETVTELKDEIDGKKGSAWGNILNRFCETYGFKAAVFDKNNQPVAVAGLNKENFKNDVNIQGTYMTAVSDMDITRILGNNGEVKAFMLEVPEEMACYLFISKEDIPAATILKEGLKGPFLIVFLIVAILSFFLALCYGKIVYSAGVLKEVSKKLEQKNAALEKELDYRAQLERERKDFFWAASHELKTPLTILKGQITGMLFNVGIYADRDTYLKKALYTTEKMEQKIVNILDVSRLESTDVQIVFEKVDLCNIIREELGIYIDQIKNKEIDVSEDIPQKLYIEGDQILLARAVENIIENAVKYSPPKARLWITIKEEAQKAVLSVENAGAHIPDDKKETIFQPFYRGEGSRNSKTGGTGLGLYIVKQTMELHHAPYRIENTRNGVKFECEFFR